MRKILGTVNGDGNVLWHAFSESPGEYQTLCGLAVTGGGEEFHRPIYDIPGGQKITCGQCRSAWNEAKRFRKTDFERA